MERNSVRSYNETKYRTDTTASMDRAYAATTPTRSVRVFYEKGMYTHRELGIDRPRPVANEVLQETNA